jgi:hypothetical protein
MNVTYLSLTVAIAIGHSPRLLGSPEWVIWGEEVGKASK